MRRLSYLLLMLFISGEVVAQTAAEILKKTEEKMKGVNSAYSEMTITTVRPKWSKTMTLKSWSKGDDYSLSVVMSPQKEQGSAFLKRNKEIWNWVPSIERTIKLPPSMMSQSWMGTDLTNDDLIRESSIVDDYEAKISGDSTIQGRTCYKIVLIAKEEAVVVWDKLILFIDKKDYIQLRSEMYDDDDYLINIMNSSNIQLMDGKYLATQMEFIPVEKEGQKTVMKIDKMDFEIPIGESFFTTQNMKTVK